MANKTSNDELFQDISVLWRPLHRIPLSVNTLAVQLSARSSDLREKIWADS
eukprot:CAMPEP_0197731952 /NCGR_PEP_ID=MMETSP1434-20131217/39137_1 /TAXON_ID=265543 /ORGANISM="Minutocellus polymorphus, Strain CCMP3303" /LENGTH=50 /DNA_ID=CAMNT_0043319049 /DNA_START=102 /DNA_END=254 /DNA_ORIENTATION=+